MRKEYRIFATRLALITALSSAGVMPGASLVPSCYATTSEAQQEADLKVSLSAEKIIEILRQDPGLLLQVKRMLIQKAYEQGRILESQDLTDDALFHLLREDDSVRALATREVEYRSTSGQSPRGEKLKASELRWTTIKIKDLNQTEPRLNPLHRI